MTHKMILLTGGARSGKSTYAEELAARSAQKVLYVATAFAGDDEMKERISVHKAQRPESWATLEAQRDVGNAILAYERPYDCILLDCMTLLTTNVMLAQPEPLSASVVEQAVRKELDQLEQAYLKSDVLWIIVTNEVGLGLVPDNFLGRLYRDILGFANQRLARLADEVLFLVSGLPMKVK